MKTKFSIAILLLLALFAYSQAVDDAPNCPVQPFDVGTNDPAEINEALRSVYFQYCQYLDSLQALIAHVDSLANYLRADLPDTSKYLMVDSIGLEEEVGAGNKMTMIFPGVASDIRFRFPGDYGSSGQILTTNGSGVTSWQDDDTANTSLMHEQHTDTLITKSDGQVRVDNVGNVVFEPGTNNDVYIDGGTSTVGSYLVYKEASDNGDNFVAFKAPASVTTDRRFVWPDGAPADNQIIGIDYDGSSVATMVLMDTVNLQALDIRRIEVDSLFFAEGDYMLADPILKVVTSQFEIINPSSSNSKVLFGFFGPRMDIKGTYSAASIRLFEDIDNGADKVALQAPSNLTSSPTFILPGSDGSARTFLITDGSENLSFADSIPRIQVDSIRVHSGSSSYLLYGSGTELLWNGLAISIQNNTQGGVLALYEDSDNGSSFYSIKAPSSLAGTVSWNLPTDGPGAGDVLCNDGFGNLYWAPRDST